MSSSSRNKKRSMDTSGSTNDRKKPKTTEAFKLLQVQQCLGAMKEYEGVPAQTLVARAEYLRQKYAELAPKSQSSELDGQVTAAYRAALQQASQVRPSKRDADIDASIQRIFGPEDPPKSKTSPAAHKKSVPAATIENIQAAQRDQVEDAIRQMASKMKAETSRIHETLQQQTTGLDALETVTEDNIEQVSKVAAETQAQAARSWRRSVGTWTVLFTVAAATAFGLVTIFMVPKRPGTCFFFCDKQQEQFCRTLPSGRQECLPREAKKGTTTASPPKKETPPPKKEDPPKKNECEMDANGECIKHEVVFSEENLVKPTGDIPAVYEGKPFAASDVRIKAAAGDLIALAAMLKQKPEFISATDSKGLTALHLAARAGRTETVKWLVEKGGANPKAKQTKGWTAYDMAVMRLGEEHSTATYLAGVMDDKGGKEEEEAEEDLLGGRYFGVDEYFLAVHQSNHAITEALLKAKPDIVDAQDKNGWGAVHQMARTGDLKMLQILQKYRCDLQLETFAGLNALKISRDKFGADHKMPLALIAAGLPTLPDGTPISPHDMRSAALNNDLQLVQKIYRLHPAWVNAQDKNGWAPLHQAARAGHVSMVRMLLKYRANTDMLANNRFTALKIAQDRHGDDHEVVKLLQSM